MSRLALLEQVGERHAAAAAGSKAAEQPSRPAARCACAVTPDCCLLPRPLPPPSHHQAEAGLAGNAHRAGAAAGHGDCAGGAAVGHLARLAGGGRGCIAGTKAEKAVRRRGDEVAVTLCACLVPVSLHLQRRDPRTCHREQQGCTEGSGTHRAAALPPENDERSPWLACGPCLSGEGRASSGRWRRRQPQRRRRQGAHAGRRRAAHFWRHWLLQALVCSAGAGAARGATFRGLGGGSLAGLLSLPRY